MWSAITRLVGIANAAGNLSTEQVTPSSRSSSSEGRRSLRVERHDSNGRQKQRQQKPTEITIQKRESVSAPSEEEEQLPPTARRRPRSPPSNVDSEAQNMMKTKDDTIATLEELMQVEQNSLETVKKQLIDLQTKHKQELFTRQVEMDNLLQEKYALHERLDTLMRDLQDEELIEGLANVINEASMSTRRSSNEDNDYVTMLQAKLCKAMHKMQVMSHQISLLTEAHERHVKSLRDDLIAAGDQRITMEVDYLTHVDKIEHEKKISVQTLLAKLNVKQERIAQLEGILEELQSAMEEGKDEGRIGKQEFDSIIALGILKERYNSLSKSMDEMKVSHEHKSEEYEGEIARLEKANEKKQNEIDRLVKGDSLAKVEHQTFNLIAREWSDLSTLSVLPSKDESEKVMQGEFQKEDVVGNKMDDTVDGYVDKQGSGTLTLGIDEAYFVKYPSAVGCHGHDSDKHGPDEEKVQ